MKKTCKKVIALVMIVAALFVFNVPALATGESDGPSDTFIERYSKVFQHVDTYEVMDSNGSCITSAFIAEFSNAYASGDFETIWNAVKANHYALQYGETEITESRPRGIMATSSVTIESAWVYRVDGLDDLVSGKTIEYAYHVVGTYTYNTSTKLITSYSQPYMEYEVGNPGSLFPYTVSANANATLGSNSSIIIFAGTFSITVSYAYSAAYSQALGPFSCSVVGNPSNL